MKILFKFIAILMISSLLAPWLVLADNHEDEAAPSEETTDSSNSSDDSNSLNESKITYDSYTYGENSDGEGGQTVYMCSGPDSNFDPFTTIYTTEDADSDLNEETELLKQKISDFEEEYSSELSTSEEASSNRCGKTEHPLTGSLEMADCAAEGKVVTEVSQSFAGDTALYSKDPDGNETLEAQVVTVYRANCCLIIEESTRIKDKDSENPSYEIIYECKDVRKVYYTSLDKCNKANPDGWSCERRQWIIGVNGASIIKVYIKQIYMWAAGTIGFIAVVTIVLNGMRITMSGVSGDVTQAKERILQSLSGLILLFLSGLILYTINPTFFS
ncbi:MAG: hypothetical protein ACI9QC_000584 [Oceanicoccus sp.]|jgi:hypothetical protein